MSFNLDQKPSENKVETKKVSSFETAKGSTYTYLENGKIERFKKVTNEKFIQDALVFIPDWNWFQSHSPKDFIEKMESGGEFTQKMLEYCQDKEGKLKIWIINEKGEKLDHTNDIQKAKKTFLYFGNYDKADFIIPVAKNPVINYLPFDTRKYEEGDGWKRQSHIGNKVVKINYEK